MTTPLARRFYGLLEPIAAMAFFAPETTEAYAALGLDPAAGYVMSRAAPMGRVSAPVVAAAFYSFHPEMIRANLRWEVAEPAPVLDARARAARAAARRLFPGRADEKRRAAEVLRRAWAAADFAGRPLAAAHAALPEPDDPDTAVWQAAATLREHRGDGHTAVLVAHGVPPADALLLDGAYNPLKREAYFRFRRFSEEEMRSAADRLRGRGFIDQAGAPTDGGRKFRQMLEMETDRLAAAPYLALTDRERNELEAFLSPVVAAISDQRAVPRFVAALAGHG